MKSPRDALLGVQEPHRSLVPDCAVNYWEDVAELGRAYGMTPDPWQEACLRYTLGERTDGKWSAPRAALSVPRQNGKNGYLELRVLAGLLVFGERILFTAHEVKTAMMSFRRIKGYFEAYPELAAQVAKISNTNGQEAIHLHSGASLQFAARSKSSGRGFSVDVLILDEAQELSDDVWAAILPTVSASANPQVILTGTPPGPTVNGEVFARFRASAIEGKDTRLTYLEWSASDDADPSDPESWAAANPALGIRLAVETIADEFASMDEETFGRERLGQWDGVASAAVINPTLWASLAAESDPTGRVCFAVDVSPDRRRASIGVAGFLGDPSEGRVMVQCIENRHGTGWVAHRLHELTERWPHVSVIVDSGGPAASLLPALKKARVKRVRIVSMADMVRACGAFFDAAEQQTLAHPDQPVLNDAVEAARKRPLGDAWAWRRKDTESDITPLVAVTLALFGLSTGPRQSSGKPGRAIVM